MNMIKAQYSIASRPNVDRAAGIIRDCVIMTTEINLNGNYTFGREDQDRIAELGNAAKIPCYLGHRKGGVYSSERLPYRIGFFEAFRVDGTRVVADLRLSESLDSNPVLQQHAANLREYVYSLASSESQDCGFSMEIGFIKGEAGEPVAVGALVGVDLVETPALTFAMFSANQEDYAHEALTPIIDLLGKLDAALKSGGDVAQIKQEALDALGALAVPAETVEPEADAVEPVEAPEVAPEVEPVEAPAEVVPEAVEEPAETPAPEVAPEVVPEVDPVEALRAEMGELKALVVKLISSYSAKPAEAPVVEVSKPVTFAVQAPVSENYTPSIATFSREEHLQEWQRLRACNVVEAARYHKAHLT